MGAGGGGGGMGGSTVRGHRGGRLFVCVRGGTVLVVRQMSVAAVAAMVTAKMGVVCAVRRLAVTAAAACSSVCGQVQFGLSACFPLLLLPRC